MNKSLPRGFTPNDDEPKPGFQIPPIVSLSHFLWLQKWRFVLAWAIVALPVAGLLLVFDLPKDYAAATVMRFPSVVGAQTNVMRDQAITQGESIISLFNSFPVLQATVEKLNLTFRIQTPEFFRQDFVTDMKVTPEAGPGDYRIQLTGKGGAVVRFTPQGSKDETEIFSGPLKPGGVLSLRGIQLTIHPHFLSRGKSGWVKCEVYPLEKAVKLLGAEVKVKPLGRSNFKLLVTDRDPYLVADIVNTLRGKFLDAYYGTTEVQDVGILAQMEKDIQLAKTKLEESQEELSRFYAANPGLNEPENGNAGDNLAFFDARQRSEQIKSSRSRLLSILDARPADGLPDESYFWAGEALGAMSAAGEPRANILRGRLAELNARQNALRAELSPQHPRLLEVQSEMSQVYAEIESGARALLKSLDSQLSQANADMSRTRPTRGPSVPVKVRLELDRLTQLNTSNQRIYDRLQESYSRAKLTTGSEFFKVAVVDEARPAIHIPPRLINRLVAASIATLVLGILISAIFLAIPAVFQKVYVREDLTRLFGGKPLGTVPLGLRPPDRDASGKKTGPGGRGGSKVPGEMEPFLLFFGKAHTLADLESYRLIRENVESFYGAGDRKGKLTLMVSSTQPGEGKTLVSSNLALTFARKGKRTLLVDADFRLGRIASAFQATPTTGLDEMLNQDELTQAEFLEAASLCFVPSVQKDLVLVPRKLSNANAGELISSDKFKAFLRLAREQFDVVIVDTPPMLITPEPLAIMGECDGVLFVCRSGKAVASEVREAVQILRDRDIQVGSILNGLRFTPFSDNPYRKYAYYYHHAGKDATQAEGTA